MRVQRTTTLQMIAAMIVAVVTSLAIPANSYAGFISEESDTLDNLGPGENELNVGGFTFSNFYLNSTASNGFSPIGESNIQVIARELDTGNQASLDFGLTGFGAFIPNSSMDAKITFKVTAPEGFYFSRVDMQLDGGTASGTGVSHILETVLDGAPLAVGGSGNLISNFDVIIGEYFDLVEATNGEDLDEQFNMIWITKDIAAIAGPDGRAAISGFGQLYTVSTEIVPEPSAIVLSLFAIVGLIGIRRFRK